MNWGYEESRARKVGARTITVPDGLGSESEPVPIVDVLNRKVWFAIGGVYVLRDATGRVMYIGITGGPLRQRLYVAISQRKTWTVAAWTDWTVTLRRAPTDYPGPSEEDLDFQQRLIREHQPPYNVLGRPRKVDSPHEKWRPGFQTHG